MNDAFETIERALLEDRHLIQEIIKKIIAQGNKIHELEEAIIELTLLTTPTESKK